jgi:hypothetical protein
MAGRGAFVAALWEPPLVECSSVRLQKRSSGLSGNYSNELPWGCDKYCFENYEQTSANWFPPQAILLSLASLSWWSSLLR